MSLKHMPRWYQYAFGALWLLSAGASVVLFAAAPFATPLTPIPALVTAVFCASIADAVRRWVAGDDDSESRQAQLTDYADT